MIRCSKKYNCLLPWIFSRHSHHFDRIFNTRCYAVVFLRVCRGCEGCLCFVPSNIHAKLEIERDIKTQNISNVCEAIFANPYKFFLLFFFYFPFFRFAYKRSFAGAFLKKTKGSNELGELIWSGGRLWKNWVEMWSIRFLLKNKKEIIWKFSFGWDEVMKF